MMARRYFVIRPNPKLLQLIQASEVEVDTIRPELLMKKGTSRNRTAEADDVALIKATYITIFLNELLGCNRADQAKLAHQIESHEFDALWTVETFNDCEDIDNLIADSNLKQESEP